MAKTRLQNINDDIKTVDFEKRLDELKKEEEQWKEKMDEMNEKREKIKEERKQILIQKNSVKMKYLRENRDVLLSLIEHDRTSCSDDNVSNGYSYSSGHYRCAKCYLIELLNGDWGDDDVEIFFTPSFSTIS